MTQTKLGPPPVENLSDVAWARVERNVLTRATGTITNAAAARDVGRERKHGSWFWLAIPAAAAAAFALAFFSMNGPAPSVETAQPSRFVAGASPSTVSLGDAHITLEANTAVVVDRKAGKPSALLENGGAVFAIAPTGQPFTVLAGDTVVHSVNATVRVGRDGERAHITVQSGSVEILFHGHEINLGAKQSWSSDHPDAVDNGINVDDIKIEKKH